MQLGSVPFWDSSKSKATEHNQTLGGLGVSSGVSGLPKKRKRLGQVMSWACTRLIASMASLARSSASSCLLGFRLNHIDFLPNKEVGATEPVCGNPGGSPPIAIDTGYSSF